MPLLNANEFDLEIPPIAHSIYAVLLIEIHQIVDGF